MAPFALTALLYGPVVPLPYFWDDFPLFNFVINKSFVQLWTDATGLPYYRPIAFTLYKIASETLPFGATALPHSVMLLVHALNAVLVGKVAGRFYARSAFPNVARGWWVEAIGAVLFAAYPFAALPLAHFAAVHHPVVILLTVGGVLSILRFADEPRGHWLALAMGCALLAPFALEAGVAAGSMIALAWAVYDWRSARRTWWALALLPFLSALFLIAWVVVPKTRPGESGLLLHLREPILVFASTTFFWQAPTYPVQPFAALLIKGFGWWDLGVMWTIGLLALIPLGVWLWRRGQWRPFAFGLGWAALASLPSIAALPFDYIAISPRLLYFPGAGGVLIWTMALAAIIESPWRVWMRAALGAALAMLAFGVPAAYLVRHAQLHVLALSPLQQFNQIVRAYPDDRHLVVNTVNWMSYRDKWYPIGNDGVPVLAPYLDPLQLVYINTGLYPRAQLATFPDLLPALNDHYLSTAEDNPERLWNASLFTARVLEFDQVWLTTYTDRQAEMRAVGHVSLGPARPPEQYVASFDERVYLTQASFTVDNGVLVMTSDWMLATGGLRPDATIFRNAFDCAGNVVGLGSGHALGGMLSLAELPPGARIHDIRHIPLETLSEDGCYQVEMGFFLSDGSRLTPRAPGGSEFTNSLVLIRR